MNRPDDGARLPEAVADAVRAFAGPAPSGSPVAAEAAGSGAAEGSDSDARLVALDFDGTLAPLVDDPLAARMTPAARAAVDRLGAALEGTTTRLALVSGRNLADLAACSEPPVGSFLVGSHGAETGRVTANGVDAVPLELSPAQE
ncbi:MAG: trehalose-phosphatase, partial [Oerskovia sp.]|nr:trehalose-phosphatase [Oerskovia sp.]